MTKPATFSVFTRKLSQGRGFLVAGGLESALSYLVQLEVDDDVADWRG
jgi:nicotinate phosphoribosyltransferase